MAAPVPRRSLKNLGEFRLIAALKRRFGDTRPGVICGIGDDAAEIRPSPGSHLLVSTDLLTEGIHFDPRFVVPYDIGYRAAVANLSDIAAMGGEPLYILAALAAPPTLDAEGIRRLYRGLMRPCRQANTALIGGDTSASATGLTVTVTILGRIEPHRALTRRGAQSGDVLYVSGTIGDAHAGLQLLQASLAPTFSLPISAHHARFLRARHLRPTARLALGRLLSTHRLATAAIDLSDGLAGDLRHICQESSVGAIVDSTALPLSPACRALATAWGHQPLDWALAGGEDYELLFTVPQHRRRRFERLASACGERVTAIGMICPKSNGIRLRMPDGTTRTMRAKSYEHFR